MALLKRVLIANRGEIAIRIAKTATAIGMDTVSVHADVDNKSLHTQMTTETHAIGGPGDSVNAYLNIEALIAAAKKADCDCVHPGYGFLSENTAFANRCAEEGLVFIGPTAETLALFGDKVQARSLAQSLDIPVIPGSKTALTSVDEALLSGDAIGYPLMLKASAGGGGRGMRAVENADEMSEAFERCQSEAEAAFGNGSVFAEKLIRRPRHIEIQILADHSGNTIHLHERDCSVQLRNQKLIEIAPAPMLDRDLKAKLFSDAIKLANSTQYLNAGTVEFLVTPETGDYYFIECNPRIQVEHTITEQITGVDLIEAQFKIASQASLADIGLADQHAVGEASGFAIQARIIAQSTGTLTAYKEPSGIGVRVDACGYLGYTPPPQFDPLLAKLIAFTGARSSYEMTIDRIIQTLAEFHISGVQTNIDQLHEILKQTELRQGNARTTLLEEMTGNPTSLINTLSPVGFLEQQAGNIINASATANAMDFTSVPALNLQDGDLAIECPMDSSVVEINATIGESVAAGDSLMVVSAMKMETTIAATTAGVVSDIQALKTGDTVKAGQILMIVKPVQDSQQQASKTAKNAWQETLDDVDTLRKMANARLGPDSDDPGVIRQRKRGKLTCKERILLLLDEGSFREVGSIAGFASYNEYGDIDAFTPANSIGGWGEIDNRTTIVCADDFTSRGGHSDGAIAAKSGYLDRLALEMRTPSIRMLDGSSGGGSVAAMVPEQKKDGESNAKESQGAIKAGRPRVAGGGGSYLPGHLGSSLYAEQLSTIPVVNLLLGSVVGIGAAKAVLGHFSVMVRDVSQLFVAGPPVVSHAMGYDISKEDLGGWHIHCTNGSVDNLAESEEEAVNMTRQFLSYLPSSVYETPPILAANKKDPIDRREPELSSLIARKRTTTFDIRKAIKLMADKDSFFEIGSLWATDQVTAFARFNGHPVGIIASDSQHVNGGAITADGCDKMKRHLDLCDLFHIPVLSLVDNPGFAVGLEHEMASTIRKGGEWMVAFAQISVPIFTVIMRRSFGVAGNNYATPRSSPSMRVAWPPADMGGIPPEGGIEAAYKRQLAEAEDPDALRAELNERIESARGPIGPLNKFQVEEMIDPQDTRKYICEWVAMAYKVTAQPARLVPRALGYRP